MEIQDELDTLRSWLADANIRIDRLNTANASKAARIAQLESKLSSARGEADFHQQRTVFLESQLRRIAELAENIACHEREETIAEIRRLAADKSS